MSAASADARALQRASLADELEAECDRLRHERELLETHLARVSPGGGRGPAEDASRSASDSAGRVQPGGKKKARGSRPGAEAGLDPPPRELSARERLDLANAS